MNVVALIMDMKTQKNVHDLKFYHVHSGILVLETTGPINSGCCGMIKFLNFISLNSCIELR